MYYIRDPKRDPNFDNHQHGDGFLSASRGFDSGANSCRAGRRLALRFRAFGLSGLGNFRVGFIVSMVVIKVIYIIGMLLKGFRVSVFQGLGLFGLRVLKGFRALSRVLGSSG